MKFLISAGALVCSIDLNFVSCKVTSGPVNSATEWVRPAEVAAKSLVFRAT